MQLRGTHPGRAGTGGRSATRSWGETPPWGTIFGCRHASLAVLALADVLVPQFGGGRFLLAGLVAGVALPADVLLHRRVRRLHHLPPIVPYIDQIALAGAAVLFPDARIPLTLLAVTDLGLMTLLAGPRSAAGAALFGVQAFALGAVATGASEALVGTLGYAIAAPVLVAPAAARDVGRAGTAARPARPARSRPISPGRRPEGTTPLLEELRGGLDRGELVLHHQPKLDVHLGRVVGVEALVRWEHPTRGLLAPAEFVPAAETSGLITSVTNRVLELALDQLRAWEEDGVDLDMAVNVSVRDLEEGRLHETLERLLRERGVPGHRLTLEVTEDRIMDDPARAVDVLRRLAVLGVRLSVDDFGTGHSSLAYLKRLPLDEIKIDRAFISELLEANSDAIIVRSVVELSHRLGLDVVAEGLEDARALGRLVELTRCDLVQGYGIARPMPPERLERWLAASVWGPAGSSPAASASCPSGDRGRSADGAPVPPPHAGTARPSRLRDPAPGAGRDSRGRPSTTGRGRRPVRGGGRSAPAHGR